MTGVKVVSRDWNEVAGDENSSNAPLGTSSHDQVLHEPLRGWDAFSATFRVMFKEEGRKSIEFAKKRQIVLFPLLLTLVTAISTIGLQFLVGDSSARHPRRRCAGLRVGRHGARCVCLFRQQPPGLRLLAGHNLPHLDCPCLGLAPSMQMVDALQKSPPGQVVAELFVALSQRKRAELSASA